VRQRTIELSQRNSELHEAITHLRTTQTQLVQSAKMASLGRLTTGIAHELKNPLNFVSNFAALDIDLCDELAETARQHPETRLADVRDALTDLRSNAEKIRQHGKRANDIVQTMVKHSGGGAGEPRPIDINALVNDFVRVAQDSARAQPVSPIRIEGELDASVRRLTVLPQDLGRVIVTLCDNAIEAVAARSRAEGPAYAPVIRAGTRRSGAAVQIFIQDNGGGIPERIRDRVFEPFFTTKPTGTGTGLGLSLSYDIVVNGHGGTLTFDTVEGEGTTFTITLPVPADPGDADQPWSTGPG
jgi:signal transduction histidine kinase